MRSLSLISLVLVASAHVCTGVRLQPGHAGHATPTLWSPGFQPASWPQTTTDPYLQAIAAMFKGLFASNQCAQWAQLFTPTGIFNHPKLPEGAQGSAALIAFCQSTQQGDPYSIYTPIGVQPTLTNTPTAGSKITTVPYIWASSKNAALPNLNWGSVVFELEQNTTTNTVLITQATEVWHPVYPQWQ